MVAVGEHVLVTEWLESPASLASVIESGTQEERDHYGELFVRFLFAGPGAHRHAPRRPAPRATSGSSPHDDGTPGRLGVLDYGAVARLPDGGAPEAMGRADPDRRTAATPTSWSPACARRASSSRGSSLDPELVLDYLAPFVEPTQVERFRFSREWMQQQFQRINDPREPTFTLALKLNLPPSTC